MTDETDWHDSGVKVISGQHLDTNTPQTPGMSRAAAINHATAGAKNYGQGRLKFIPMPKRVYTTMEHSRASSTSLAGRQECGGDRSLNM